VEELVETRGKKQDSRINSRTTVKAVRLSELGADKIKIDRFSSGSSEFDRVLGGGIVPGSVVLVAGEPGIGKSTLLTQLALRQAQEKLITLYVCGEESPDQVAMRIRRMGKAKNQEMLMLPTTDVDQIVAVAEKEKPGLMIVDSIQTLTTGDLAGMAGSVGQVRESGNRLIALAKNSGTAVFVVGHVTKDGTVAGPKVLEHMVDAVLTLEGEKTGMWRILRAQKYRFGATDEVGVFEMREEGMMDVANPSGLFLEESQAGVAGSAVVALMEGTRPVMVEIQALTVESNLLVPRRVASGVPLAKMQLLIAVLQKHARLGLGNRDCFVNVAGGLKVTEPAADLAIAMALASSFTNKPLPKNTVLVGEVGLLGEVRKVTFLEKRIKEAKKLGFSQVISAVDFKRIGIVVKELLG